MRITILFFIFTSNILAEEIIGIPRIVDGDTIHINEYKIRLEGIDAPEIKQKCKKAKLAKSRRPHTHSYTHLPLPTSDLE